jgi:Membrane bound beta barrel domain (DUF5777)
MKKLFVIPFLFFVFVLNAQTTDDLLKEGEKKVQPTKEAAIIFNHGKVINANTTEMVGKGKMDFIVTHNFGDFAGTRGGIKNFFGLDDSRDIRIGFTVGFGKNFDAAVSRLKGFGPANHLVETSIKYRFLQQTMDNSTPISLALFINNTISTVDTAFSQFSPGAITSPIVYYPKENHFQNFGDRTSQVFQLIIAKKIGKVSLQLNPTYLTTGFVLPDDDKNLFALGAAIRFPVSNRVNIIMDYFHPFRSDHAKNSVALKEVFGSKVYDPLSVGIEILTGGHVFHLNFTNSEAITENQFLRRTLSTWSKGQFRWGFNLSRTFSLWKEK